VNVFSDDISGLFPHVPLTESHTLTLEIRRGVEDYVGSRVVTFLVPTENSM
jgi:hypothetical protein